MQMKQRPGSCLLSLPRDATRFQVDIACHDRRCRVFAVNFAVELHFDNVQGPAPLDASSPCAMNIADLAREGSGSSSNLEGLVEIGPSNATITAAGHINHDAGREPRLSPFRRIIRPDPALVARSRAMRRLQRGDPRAVHTAACSDDPDGLDKLTPEAEGGESSGMSRSCSSESMTNGGVGREHGQKRAFEAYMARLSRISSASPLPPSPQLAVPSSVHAGKSRSCAQAQSRYQPQESIEEANAEADIVVSVSGASTQEGSK
jgi:hypothetical protein